MGLFIEQSEVFAVAFAVLAAGAVILTLNVLLLVNLSLSLALLNVDLFVGFWMSSLHLNWRSLKLRSLLTLYVYSV